MLLVFGVVPTGPKNCDIAAVVVFVSRARSARDIPSSAMRSRMRSFVSDVAVRNVPEGLRWRVMGDESGGITLLAK